ncbi:MAG: inorganic diphosphatase, partial [Lachnospiraceae bacterium]|nr:inorganic diphosphatase [Lachnospiraceae bacterium]
MLDCGMGDEKIIAMPYGDPNYNMYHDISELPKHIFDEIQHFFSVYKNLEGKETKVDDILNADEAVKVIEHCIENYSKKYGKRS